MPFKGLNWVRDGSSLRLDPFRLKYSYQREVETPGFQIVLIRTEKKYETVVNEKGYSLNSPAVDLQQSPLGRTNGPIFVFRHLKVEDFTELSDEASSKEQHQMNY